MELQFILGFLSIVAIDLVLAGDNAVVIAMAAHRLEPSQRKKAIFIGAALAVILRVLTTFLVAQLLQVPFLSAKGWMRLRAPQGRPAERASAAAVDNPPHIR